MITFILNNKTIQTDANAGLPLLDFIRENANLKGTKIGCREGDCGACTVLVGTLQKDNTVQYQSITSCISPLGNAQGKHIVTVEGTNLTDSLTVQQEAMHANFATQCGFCTPGFVVSLTGFALSDKEKNTATGLNAISGNICRCTGYKSIEKAVVATANALEKLSPKDLIAQGFIPQYFENIAGILKQIQYKNSNTKGQLVAGGTDLYVRHADTLAATDVNLTYNDSTLKGIDFKEGKCKIGAGTTVTDLLENETFNSYFPKLKKHLKLISSEQIRNMATLAGNIVNASPIGDMTIFFLALDAKLIIQEAQGFVTRTVALKDFYKDYKQFDLEEKEMILDVIFDLPNKNTVFNFEKVSKRTHLDIASVNTAAQLEVKNNTIIKANISIGGVAAIPTYLHKTSAFLVGKTIDEKTLAAAKVILQKEISPISDIRGTMEYKRLLASQLFAAHFMELFELEII
jgi:xanthine dehydrogenase small subunit